MTQWEAMLLLVIHGLAGVIWIPASQVLIHQIVCAGTAAERGSAQCDRPISGFFGGARRRGGVAARLWTDVRNIRQCADLCCRLFLWLISAPYGRDVPWYARRCRRAVCGFADIWSTMKVVAAEPGAAVR